MLVHIFPYNISSVQVKSTIFCSMSFHFQVIDSNTGLIPVSNDGYSFDKCVFPVSGSVNTQDTRVCGSESRKEVQKHDWHIEKATVWFAVYANVVKGPCYLNHELAKKSIVNNSWTLSSSQTPNNSNLMLYSRSMERFLKFYAPVVPS